VALTLCAFCIMKIKHYYVGGFSLRRFPSSVFISFQGAIFVSLSNRHSAKIYQSIILNCRFSKGSFVAR